MTQRASEMRVLLIRGRRTNHLLRTRERRRGLLLYEGLRDRVAAPRAKVRISYLKMGDTSGLIASQGRGCVSSATSLDTLDGIALKGRDPRVMGLHTPSHQWDMHRHSLFLPTQPWSRKDNRSPRVLWKHLILRRRATWAKAWVEVEEKAHMLRLWGPRGVSTPLHHRLR